METFLIIGGALLFIFIVLYNTLISKKNQVDNIFAGLDAILKKRYNLIPNLVATLKEYMLHEAGTFEKITSLRSQALQPSLNAHDKMTLDKELSSMLSSLMVTVENYPVLQANENFLHLQHTLHEVEEQISAARRAYNQSVTDYNNALEMFPINLLAGFMRLEKKEVLRIDVAERENVNVKNLFR